MAKADRAPKEGRFDLTEIRALAKLLKQYDLSELELDSGGERLCIRRHQQEEVVTRIHKTPPAKEQQDGGSNGEQKQDQDQNQDQDQIDDGTMLISSPFVGTFYRAPNPEASPFVKEGQLVKRGQALCIVEAMKLMNEIEAEADCKVIQILAKNAEAVEFGQALFKVFPLA